MCDEGDKCGDELRRPGGRLWLPRGSRRSSLQRTLPGKKPGRSYPWSCAGGPTTDARAEGAAGRGSSLPAFPAHLLPSDLSTSEAVTSSGQTMGDGPSIHSVYVCVPTDTMAMHAPRSFNLGGKGQFIQERPTPGLGGTGWGGPAPGLCTPASAPPRSAAIPQPCLTACLLRARTPVSAAFRRRRGGRCEAKGAL